MSVEQSINDLVTSTNSLIANIAATQSSVAANISSSASAAATSAAAAAVASSAIAKTADLASPTGLASIGTSDGINAQLALASILQTSKQGNTYWNSVFAPLDSTDVPTISVSQAAQLSNATLIQPTPDFNGNPNFRYDGCLDVVTSSAGFVWMPTSPSGIQYYCNPEFVTDQANNAFELVVYCPAAGNDIGIRVIVDGKMHSFQLQRFSGISGNTVYYVLVSFPTARSRDILVELESISQFGGVRVASGQTVKRPLRDVRNPIGLLGDSYTRGAAYTSGGASGLETFAYYVARLLGADRIVNFAIGGTGWVNAGTYSPFGNRVPEILSSGIATLIVLGSQNDTSSYTAGVYDAVRAAMTDLITLPFIQMAGPAQPQYGTINSAVKAAATSLGLPFVDVSSVITPDLRFTDGVHPSAAGHIALAKAYFAALNPLSVQATINGWAAGRTSADTTLTTSPVTPQISGTSVNLTATLSQQLAGKVAFTINGVEASRVTVSGGVATYNAGVLAIGTNRLVARFIPTNPGTVKQSVSNAINYTITTNLGFTDNFNRADGAVGNTANSKPWTAYGSSGAWQISNNALVNTTISAGTNYYVVDANTPNGTFSIKIGGSAIGLIALRLVDQTNTLRLSVISGQITLQQVVGNVSTTLATGSTGPWVAGDTIAVTLSGDTISVKRNGTDVTGIVGVTVATFDTATRFGVGLNSGGTACTFDDASFV